MKSRPIWSSIAVTLLVARAASAQLALDRLSPGAPGGALISGSDANIASGTRLELAARGVYAQRPLVLRVERADGSQSNRPLVSDQLALHAQASLSLRGALALDLDVPVLATSGRASDAATVGVGDPSGWALGDVRAGLRVQFTEDAGGLPALALQTELWLPTGDPARLAGAREVRTRVGLLVSKDLGPLGLRAGVGRRRQSDNRTVDGILSSDADFFAGARLGLGAWSIGPELFGSTYRTSQHGWLTPSTTNLELLLAGDYRVSWMRVSLAAGPGLSSAPGTPRFRAVVGLEFPLSFDAPVAPAPPPAPEVVVVRSNPARSTSSNPANQLGAGAAASNAKATLPAVDCRGSCAQTGAASDEDSDGVPDAQDACPHEAGAANADAAVSGCPNTVRVSGSQIVLPQALNFDNGKDTILESSLVSLEQVAAILRDQPAIVRVAIEGHTDNVGGERRNLALSRRRAVSVMRWLIAHGVDERRLEARGFGPRRPIADPATEAGRAKNRRVEFLILKQDDRGAAAWKDGVAND